MVLMRIILFSLFFYMPAFTAHAAPSGADLLSACQQSIANHFVGAKGMLCKWYVTPCDCNIRQEETTPRVCLPEEVNVKELANEVIEKLLVRPDLQQRSAEYAAAMILVERYPCDNE